MLSARRSRELLTWLIRIVCPKRVRKLGGPNSRGASHLEQALRDSGGNEGVEMLNRLSEMISMPLLADCPYQRQSGVGEV